MADRQSDADKIRDKNEKIYGTTMASLREKFSELDGESKEKVLEDFKRILGTGSTPAAASSLMEKMNRLADMQLGDNTEKKYTGGKVGDKYYGGGPVYPRPTKGS